MKDEVDRYNNHQVHLTTGEIPAMRFENAKAVGNSLFWPFSLPKPYKLPKDVFCLHETRMVNGCRHISLFKHDIKVPNVPLYEEIEVRLIPNTQKQTVEIRIWWNTTLVHSVVYPLREPPVHF